MAGGHGGMAGRGGVGCFCAPDDRAFAEILAVRYMCVYAGTSVFPTSNYYPSGPGPNTVNALSYSIPLFRSMNDTGYKTTVSIQQIYAQISVKKFNLIF